MHDKTTRERQLKSEIRAVKEALVVVKEDNSHQYPQMVAQAEHILAQHDSEHLIQATEEALEAHLERLERDLQHVREGWD
ncbi:hypothetical protein [Natranaeroarchaeum aerophilus]|uniref:Uncharacterized protein n=1 Tax=Natranaeroarchaeum aerophilus TaxID=2917711 RepID=A0AAE3FRR7_9EURY|nr:hypothetical protein [Natranaeroarchaeum aerophilus]MCL9814397.1 hypothetical protein [Natranaeroarchaeum aerophilus]